MLEVRACGGLGNQMFQFAFVRYLELMNKDVKLNISDFKIHSHHQGFELKKVFGIDENYNENECTFAIRRNSVFFRAAQKLLNAVLIREGNEYYEHPEASFVEKKMFQSDLYFLGFWQDERYVSAVSEQLQKDFTFVDISSGNQRFINRMGVETVSLHIRRGDYVRNPSLGTVCDKEYYRRAICYMKEKLASPLFVVFSDEIEWCRSELAGIHAEFADWNVGSDSWADMQLMSKCSHNIIANSTFSWWGAWLNKNPEKIVLCPERWNIINLNKHMVCEGWHPL